MAVEPRRAHDRDGPLFGVEHDPILVYVEFECAAIGPRRGERRVRAKERYHSFRRQRQPAFAMAFLRGLGLLISQPRRRAHQSPLKPMPPFAAGRVYP